MDTDGGREREKGMCRAVGAAGERSIGETCVIL